MNKVLKIGTRGSPLALAQVALVRAALAEAWPDLETEVVVIRTSGDWRPEDGDVRLSDAEGGKAQFAKEIEEALLAGVIDCAVHSMKDMDSVLPDGLVIEHMLPREDVRDVLLFSNKLADISREKGSGVFAGLPQGARVGTVSVRRAAFLLSERPDLKIEPIRGNVQTRIDKVRSRKVDCTCLALAGLKRLGLEAEADLILEPEDMLPAAGQGAVGIEVRAGDDDILAIFSRISCSDTVLCVKAERAALAVLSGSCHTPIGAYAMVVPPSPDGYGATSPPSSGGYGATGPLSPSGYGATSPSSPSGCGETGSSLSQGFGGTEIYLRVCVISEDGCATFFDEERGVVDGVGDAERLGRAVGERLKAVVPVEILGGFGAE